MSDIIIAGMNLDEWFEFAKQDDCLEQMAPSDLRQILALVDDRHAAINESILDALNHARVVLKCAPKISTNDMGKGPSTTTATAYKKVTKAIEHHHR